MFNEIKSLINETIDPVLKLELVMDFGNNLLPIPDGKIGTEIKGCSSKVFIYQDPDKKLYANADSKLVSGIVYILLTMKQENIGFDEFAKLNLNLGSSRLTGTASMIAYLSNL